MLSFALFLWLKLLSVFTLHNKHLIVPDFRNIHINSMDSLTRINHMRYVVIDSIVDVKKQKGIVIHQDPFPGSKVKKNRCIYLTINALQQRTVLFPDINDYTLRQAIRSLESIGLKAGRLDYKADIAKNRVLAYKINGIDIKPGQELYEGTIVDLVVGNGLSDNLVLVPNLVGLLKEEAKSILKLSSLNIGAEIFDSSILDSSNCFVVKQHPKYNDKRMVNIGSSIDLFYSKDYD